MSLHPVKISLTKTEALLIDSFLRRFTEKDLLEPSKAETQALFNLCCVLEREIPELFLPDYDAILEKAEKNIFEQEG